MLVLTADEDKRVSDERSSRQLGEVADHRKREEEDELTKDEGCGRDTVLAVRDGEDEGLEVFGDEDGVRWGQLCAGEGCGSGGRAREEG